MERSRLRAYMSLIRELLRCPSGDELSLLQANLELVDTNLIHLMEQVANRATDKGALGTADFLRDLAQEIRQTLVPSKSENSSEGEISSAYMRLIEALLNCPSGAETDILRANQDLIDTGFVLSLQQLATTLSQIGEKKASEFLQNIAVPLTEAISGGSSSALPIEYLDLLGEVLRVTASSNGDAKVVYQLLEENSDKLTIEFAQTLDEWAVGTLATVKPEIAQSIAADLVKFSTLMQEFPGAEQAYNLEIAIVGYEVSLRAYRRDKFPQKWAEVQNYLGTAYLNRLFGEKATNLEVAIECHKAALEIFKREDFPQEWASTQYCLGTVYQSRIYGDKAENSRLATQYFKAALGISEDSE